MATLDGLIPATGVTTDGRYFLDQDGKRYYKYVNANSGWDGVSFAPPGSQQQIWSDDHPDASLAERTPGRDPSLNPWGLQSSFSADTFDPGLMAMLGVAGGFGAAGLLGGAGAAPSVGSVAPYGGFDAGALAGADFAGAGAAGTAAGPLVGGGPLGAATGASGAAGGTAGGVAGQAAGGLASGIAGGLGNAGIGALAGGALGLLGGGNKPAGNITTVQDIPEWLKPYVTANLQGAQGVLAKTTQPSNLLPSAEAEMTKTINGQYLMPGANPYLDATFNQAARGLTDTYQNVTQPRNDALFNGPGSLAGNSAYQGQVARNQWGLGENLSSLATQIYGGNYQNERNRQFGAATGAPAFSGQSTQAQFSPYQSMNSLFPNIRSETSPYFQNQMGGLLGGALAGAALGRAF